MWVILLFFSRLATARGALLSYARRSLQGYRQLGPSKRTLLKPFRFSVSAVLTPIFSVKASLKAFFEIDNIIFAAFQIFWNFFTDIVKREGKGPPP